MEASVPTVKFAVLLGVLGLSFPSTPQLMTSSQYYSTVAVGNGSTRCATDNPSSLESATNRLRCGQLCVLRPFCYHFNYFAKKKQCAMFYTPPKSFSILDGCRSYKAQPQPRALTILADEIIRDIYADGQRIPSAPVYDAFMLTGAFFFPRSTRTLAIRITNALNGYAALLASEINGNLLTNIAWKVQRNYTDGWMASTFEDSGWEGARGFSGNPSPIYGNKPSISKKALWITSPSNPNSKVLYFRVHP